MKITPNLHDAELYALRHDANSGTVESVFRTVAGEDAALLLSGVTRFRCTDFGLQNVVFELMSTAWQQISFEDLHSYVIWLYTTADGEQLVSAEKIEQIVQDVMQGKLQCVFLIPSWGAQLGAIAAEMKWQ